MKKLFFAMLCFLTFTSNAQNFIETLKGERFDNIDESEVKITFDKIYFNYNGKKESIKVEKIKSIPKINPKSPTRFKIIALIAALLACTRENQKFISK